MTRVAIKGGYLEVAGPGDHPDNTLPGSQPGIDNELPGAPPGHIDNTLPPPPPGLWPPASFDHPWLPIPGDGELDQGLPQEPGTIWPPVGGGADGKFWVVAGIPGVGWRYVCVDIGLRIDQGLPGDQPGMDNTLPGRPPHMSNRPPGSKPPVAGQPLPPTAQPKT